MVLCGEHEAGRWKGETWSKIGENWGFWVRKGKQSLKLIDENEIEGLRWRIRVLNWDWLKSELNSIEFVVNNKMFGIKNVLYEKSISLCHTKLFESTHILFLIFFWEKKKESLNLKFDIQERLDEITWVFFSLIKILVRIQRYVCSNIKTLWSLRKLRGELELINHLTSMI